MEIDPATVTMCIEEDKFQGLDNWNKQGQDKPDLNQTQTVFQKPSTAVSGFLFDHQRMIF